MSYTLNWKNPALPGKSSITVNPASTNSTSASVTFTGKGAANYGQIEQQNLMRLLENFADATSPANPTIGQLWYDSTNSILNLCTAIAPLNWAGLAGVQVTSGAAPAIAKLGDLWLAKTGSQSAVLYVYTGLGRFPASLWNPYTEGAWPAAAPAAAPFSGIRLNFDSFTTANFSEGFIHGFTGSTAANVDGTILVDGVATPLPRGGLATMMRGTHFIMSGILTLVPSHPQPYVAVRYVGLGNWEWDDNTQWQPFTPTSATRIIGTVTVGSNDNNAAPGLSAGAIWTSAILLTETSVSCAPGGALAGIGGWEQVWPTIEQHGARFEYDAMLELVSELIGSYATFGGNNAAANLDLPDLATLDAGKAARWDLAVLTDTNVASNQAGLKIEPSSADWDRLLAACRWAVDRLDLPPTMTQDISNFPFTQDGLSLYSAVANLPLVDVRRPSLDRSMSARRIGAISSTRFFIETMNVLSNSTPLRYTLKGIAGSSSTVTALSPALASRIVARVTASYTGTTPTEVTVRLNFRSADEKNRFMRGGSAVDIQLAYAPGAVAPNNAAYSTFIGGISTIRVTADAVRTFNGSGTMGVITNAGMLNASAPAFTVLANVGNPDSTAGSWRLSAYRESAPLQNATNIQLTLRFSGFSAITGVTTVTARTIRDTTTYGADAPFFEAPVSVVTTGSFPIWATQAFTAPPVAAFTVSATTGPAPLAVTFTSTSTGAPTHEWDTNGLGLTAGTATRAATYTAPGVYAVRLRVTNAGGQDVLTRPTYITVT